MRTGARPRGARLAVVLAMVAGAGPSGLRAAPAQDSSAAPRPWFEQITVNGFASTSYSYNVNRPATRLNAYRVFDFDDNTFKLDGVELVAQHAAASLREAGFRVDLALGGSVPRVSAASGLFRDPVTGVAQDVDLQQAFVTYVVPLGPGLRVDAGKFITFCGSEVIEGYDGWNDDATHSFLFGFAIPFTHTGVRAAYGFGPRVSVTALVANGWDAATDNNRAKTAGAQLALAPAPALSLLLNGLIGAERPGDDRDVRSLLDGVLTAKAGPRLTLGLNADLGRERVPGGAHVTWSGIAGYARWQATPRFALAARGESFDDPDGARTGTRQSLAEATLTPELRLTLHLVLRGDLRLDHSSRDVFPTSRGVRDTQATVLVNALAAF